MLNLSIGALQEVNGKRFISTTLGTRGHALYGPYDYRSIGKYTATFILTPAESDPWKSHDRAQVCAIIDVAADNGKRILARQEVRLADIVSGPNTFSVEFRLKVPMTLEYRIEVTGIASFLIEDGCNVAMQYESPLLRHANYVRAQLNHVESLLYDDKESSQYLGLAPDQYIATLFETRPENALYEAMCGGSLPIRKHPVVLGLQSTLCRHVHFTLDEYRYWMSAMGRTPRFHRKDWEWFYIAQGLFDAGVLRPGAKGLVFAVGLEPLPAVFAALGCEILATDQAPDQAVQSGWATSGQHSQQVENLFNPAICPADTFFPRVRFESMDMNAIPEHHDGTFDFCWSSCSLEHLGSLEHGMRFVENAMRTLKPAGVSIHTTEFNMSSNDVTIENETVSIYRKRDIESLVDRLTAAGHRVAPIDWTEGHGFAETVIDLPPYRQSPHLRLQVQEFETTSIGLIIYKSAA